MFLLSSPEANTALDAVEPFHEDFSDIAKVILEGVLIGITATDLTSTAACVSSDHQEVGPFGS